MKKIVAFSLFGSDPKYYVGAEKNITLTKEHLPDWEVSIYYHPDSTEESYINKIKTMDCNVINVADIDLKINKPITDYPIPFFWRFFSFFDDNISIVRDLDSRISKREADYINRWINGDKNYFVIRDHTWHSQYPAGLFGMRGKSDEFKTFTENFINNTELLWGHDQLILEQFMKDVDKINIEYCGYDIPETYIQRDNKDFFIGIQLDENDNPTYSGLQGLEHLKNAGL